MSLGVHVISEKIKQLAMPYENHTTEEGQNEYDKKYDQLYWKIHLGGIATIIYGVTF